MKDWPVSVTATLATLLWLVGLTLGIVYAATGTRGTGVIGLMFVIGGATLTVRCYLVGLACYLTCRERNAFELGLDAQRLRSVD